MNCFQRGEDDPGNFAHSVDEQWATPAPRSILVVDDEYPIVSFVSQLLEDEGFNVAQAYTGEEALDIMRRDPPELVISDVLMPGATGYDVIRFARSRPREYAPKVILMSANLSRSPRKKVPLLQKPFDIDELLDLVNAILDEETGKQSA